MPRTLITALALGFTCLTAYAAPPARTNVVMAGVTTDQVKNAYATWCIVNGLDVAEAESNRVVCTKPVQGGRGFLIQALSGNGSAPVVRLEFSFGQSGADVVATAKQQLETQRADGVMHREDFKQADVIAGTQEILDEVAASLAPTAAAPPTASDTSGAVPPEHVANED